MRTLTVTEIIKTRTIPIDRHGCRGKWSQLDCSFEEAIKEKIFETKGKWGVKHQIARFYYDLEGKNIAWDSGVIVIGGIIKDCETEKNYTTFEEYVQDMK
jgi:hypothetical protein